MKAIFAVYLVACCVCFAQQPPAPPSPAPQTPGQQAPEHPERDEAEEPLGDPIEPSPVDPLEAVELPAAASTDTARIGPTILSRGGQPDQEFIKILLGR